MVITVCAEMFVIDPSSFDGCRDLRGYRGIEKTCYHAFEVLGLGSLPWPFAACDGVLAGKQ